VEAEVAMRATLAAMVAAFDALDADSRVSWR
jgi:hypothetical protein